MSTSRKVPVELGRVQPESRLSVSGAADVVAIRREVLAARQKQALHATVHDATSPAKAIAEAAGVKYSTLANAALTSTEDQLAIRFLPMVLSASDNLALLRFYAQLQHCAIYRLPRVGAAGDARQVAAVMRQVAELLEAAGAAAEDGVITPQEFAGIEHAADHALRTLLEFAAHFRARVQRPLLEDV
jgi:hypothetical protein